MDLGVTGGRCDPLDRRCRHRPAAAPPSYARGNGSTAHARARALGGAPGGRPFRRLSRRRRTPRHGIAPHVRSPRCARGRHRRLMTGTETRGGFEGLDACVHCGFCLQACPTFLATGDESDSPRGRIELMRGLERGDLTADDAALSYHLDRCLGCRGCEPVCPSGVQYGHALEAARARLTAVRGVSRLARLALWALTTPGVRAAVYWFARGLRATGLPRRLAGWGRFGFAMGMLGATKAHRRVAFGVRRRNLPFKAARVTPHAVQIFRGCVMQGLFSHVP